MFSRKTKDQQTKKSKIRSSLSWLTATKKRQRLSILVGILVIGLTGQVIYSSFAATTVYSPIPEVAKMQQLTDEVVATTEEYASMPDTIANKKGAHEPNQAKEVKKQELINKVKERKDAYKIAMQYDPQTTADFYLPYTTRDKLPSEAVTELEQVKVVKGTWSTLLVFQGPDSEANEYVHDTFNAYITDTNKTDIYVYGTNIPSIHSGTPVTTLGVVIDDVMAMTLPGVKNSQPSSDTSNSNINSLLIQTLRPSRVQAQTITVDPNPGDPERLCAIPEIADFVTSFVGGDLYEDIAKKCHEKLGGVAGKVFCVDNSECQTIASDPVPLTGDNGKRKTLVIPLNYKQDQANPLTIAELDDSYRSLATIYNDMSYGKFKPEYDLFQRWVTIDDSNIYECGSVNDAPNVVTDKQNKVKAQINKVARNAMDNDTELSNQVYSGGYTDVMYVHNKIVCSDPDMFLNAGGWAMVGYNRGGGYLAETTMLLTDVTKTQGRQWLIRAMAHELGHSFGLGHAHGACNDVAPTNDAEELDLSKYCTAEHAEYADPYNLMGDGAPLTDSMSFNFDNKARLGWVSVKEDAQSISSEGSKQVTLNALHKTSGIRAIKLKYKDKDLYMEYRPKTDTGTDRFVEGSLRPGILAYFANDDHTTSLLGSFHQELQGSWLWTYDTAGQQSPFKIGEGKDSICVIPSNATEDGVDIKVQLGEDCGNYKEVSNYVYEKSIDSTIATDIEVDKDGNMYLLNRNVVSKLDKDGKLLSSFTVPFGIIGSKLAINSKGDIYLSAGNIIGAHERNIFVLKYDKDGNELARWDPGSFRSIVNGISHDGVEDILTDQYDNVYFMYQRYGNPAWSDFTESYIMEYNEDLSSESARWKLTYRNIGRSIALDKENKMSAFEQGRYNHSLTGWNELPEHCIHKFSSKGDDLSRWCKGNPKVAPAGSDVFNVFDSMQIDNDGNYLMRTEWLSEGISMYGAGHQYIGSIGNGRGPFYAIELASDGKLYAVTSNAVKVFSPEAKTISFKDLSN